MKRERLDVVSGDIPIAEFVSALRKIAEMGRKVFIITSDGDLVTVRRSGYEFSPATRYERRHIPCMPVTTSLLDSALEWSFTEADQ